MKRFDQKTHTTQSLQRQGTDKNHVHFLVQSVPKLRPTQIIRTLKSITAWQLAKELDIVSWDSYPSWHNDYEKTWELASRISFVHDINRSLKAGSKVSKEQEMS